MLSSLSLCIPREWNLHCSALSGPLATTGATTGIFRKAPARQAAGGDPHGSPSGEELEGESSRGGPSHFNLFFEKNVVLKSHSNNSGGKCFEL